MKKIRAAAAIARNSKGIVEDTAGELAFDDLFEGRSVKPASITITEGEKTWTLRPDRQFKDTNVVVEIDGPYHRTRRQMEKTQWRDGALLARGFRVIHIASELLTTQKYWPHVKSRVHTFMEGNRLVDRIDA